MTENTTASGAAELPEALRLAAFLEGAAWHKITLSDARATSSELRRLHALAASAAVAPTMVDMVPPATRRDRWMYEQGRLAERDPRTSRAAPVAPAPQAAINPRTQYLTVVYRGVEAGDEARVICDHPKVSAVSWGHALNDRDAALAARGAAQAAPAYKDSTPELHVGESSFEGWFSEYDPAGKGDKQRARDAYAAGMGDPLVTAQPAPVAEDAAYTELHGQINAELCGGTSATNV